MDRKWMRILSTLTCLALLFASVPVGAEEIAITEGSIDVPVIEAPVSAPDPVEAPQPPAAEPMPEPVPVAPAPADAPAEAPAEVPAEAPAEAPAQEPAEAPAEQDPTEAPVEETPTEAPAEQIPTEAPAQDPTEAPVELPADAPSLEELISQWIAALDAQGFSNDYQKAFWLYDRLIANLDHGSADDAQIALTTYSASPVGYALAYEALMRAAGIECVTVLGENAAWNAAKIDGEWTHIDAWMDDATDCFGLHFGLTDAAMARDHAWKADAAPVCADTRNNYFVRERGYQPFASQDDLQALLISAVENQTAELYLYNAGAQPAAAEAIDALLSEIDSSAVAETAEQGCYAAVQLRYDAAEAASKAADIISIFTADEPIAVMSVDAAPIAAQSIVPKANSLTLGVGEKASVSGWTMLPAGTQETVTYKSKSTKIATVDNKGNVTAKKAGSTTITISAASGVSCTVAITVKKAPTSIKITAPGTELGVGETMQLGYKLSSGSAGKVTFSVPAGQKVASITPDGELTALDKGKVTVTAKTYNGKKKTASITVKPAPKSVTFSAESVTLGKNDSYAPSVKLSSGAASTLSYTSADTTVAVVDPDTGKIFASSNGETDVTVTTHNGKEDTLHVAVVDAPTSLKLTAPHTEMGLKETMQLVPVFNDYAGDNTTITYVSNKTSVVKVSATGLVTAKKTGTATITATSYNGLKATVKLTVKKAPTSIKITAPGTELGVGETMQLGYKLSSGSAGGVTFSVPADQKVASITPDGKITALDKGKVTVTATTYNGKKKTGVLTVKSAPTSVTLSAKSVTLGKGDSFTPSVKLNSDAVGKVSFSSSKTSVAKVDPDSGKITAADSGDAVITAETYNGLKATLKVKVVAAPKSLSLSAPRTTLGVKETLQLTSVLDGFKGDNCAITYTSSKASVAKVSATGLITAKKAGTTTITAATYNDVKATIKITVKKAPTSVKITCDRTVLGVGEKMQLGYKLSSGAAGEVTFSVPANQKIASITPDGEITALKAGEVTITATAYNGKKKTGVLTVKPAPKSITISNPNLVLGVGATATLSASVNDGSAGKLYYRLEDSASKVASIDENGMITALKIGKVRLIAYTYASGVQATADLEVKAKPESISLAEKSIDLGVGDTYQIQPKLNDGAGASFTYKSSKKTYATVNAAGVITAKKVGKTTITVTTYNGLSAKLTVNVKKQPSSIKVDPASVTLGLGETVTLNTKLPSGTATTLSYKSQNAKVATVNSSGVVTAVAVGDTKITITAHNGKSATCAVHVAAAPTSISLTMPELLGVKQTVTPVITLKPKDSHTTPVYSIVSGNAVEIDKNGNIVAVREGTATIRVSTHVKNVYAERKVTVKAAPSSISFAKSEYSVDIGSTLQLSPTLPSGTATELTYTIKKDGYFTIDENGLVTPIKRGSSTVTVTTHNGKSASTTVWVVDPSYPEIIRFADTPPTSLEEGKTYKPKLYVFPETASAEMQWTSSVPAVASVNASTGAVKALSYGSTTIKGTSTRNSSLSVSFKLLVTSDRRCLIMPEHRTDTSKISATLQQIKNVRASAYQELDELVSKGWISNSERATRKGYIDRAFDMYLFPWMTTSKVLYWRAANSENGGKDFKPGTVYYGMPYTQVMSMRMYSPSTATSKGYFKDSGKGYSLLQTSKFTSRNYPGSDCSAFVSMAIWGDSSSRKGDNTVAIGNASYYTTLSSKYADDLRPGDLLNKSGSHVVMFLYYANSDRTQIVVIEQGGGGSDKYSNCVSTTIHDISYYSSRGYKIRRVSSLDQSYKK